MISRPPIDLKYYPADDVNRAKEVKSVGVKSAAENNSASPVQPD